MTHPTDQTPPAPTAGTARVHSTPEPRETLAELVARTWTAEAATIAAEWHAEPTTR